MYMWASSSRGKRGHRRWREGNLPCTATPASFAEGNETADGDFSSDARRRVRCGIAQRAEGTRSRRAKLQSKGELRKHRTPTSGVQWRPPNSMPYLDRSATVPSAIYCTYIPTVSLLSLAPPGGSSRKCFWSCRRQGLDAPAHLMHKQKLQSVGRRVGPACPLRSPGGRQLQLF